MTINDTNQVLNVFLKDTSSKMCLLLDNNSKVLGQVEINYADSVAVLSNGILSMVEKFSQDMSFGKLKQLQIKTTECVIFFQKVSDKSTLVVFIEENMNIILFLKRLDEVSIELNK